MEEEMLGLSSRRKVRPSDVRVLTRTNISDDLKPSNSTYVIAICLLTYLLRVFTSYQFKSDSLRDHGIAVEPYELIASTTGSSPPSFCAGPVARHM
jgi:hypothetical protein